MTPHPARAHTVPFLPKQHIEQEAALLLAEYVEKHPVARPPVPIDEIVELHLGLTLEIEDLRAQFGHGDVLGALWIDERLVRVDTSLDPTDNPRLLGRYHFTLAHEAGHWRLHRPYYERDRQQGLLFTEKGEPAYVCRSSEAKEPVEWQADYFAGCLLMPRPMVQDMWITWRGSPDPVCIHDTGLLSTGSDRRAAENAAMDRFCRPLAREFGVSAEALRIRLEHLELLLREKPNTLF